MANEFISRKELIKNFWEFTNGGKQRYLIPEEIWEMVELAPTADVVEVVRCKDCSIGDVCEYRIIGEMKDNDYCSYEKKVE